jgi:hypothetical protein
LANEVDQELELRAFAKRCEVGILGHPLGVVVA